MKIFSPTIEKSEVAKLPNVLFEGRIITIDSEGEAERAAQALSKESILGIDTETRPSFRKGVHYSVSLLQLSTADTCFLFRLCRTGITNSLKQLLENTNIKKIGVSLHDDYHALNEKRRFTPGNFIDLQKYVSNFGIEEMSLQKIYAIIFAQRISKSQQLTNWDADVLTDKQKLYAATDAWACLNIYNHLETIRTQER
ncbi:MAG: 3'-5' exonuclease domain-containing protein 2 [Bacteroidaceae bacterium]|jgi:ribonuclease D|nr:3'-5' exonuclease domain-containing protein 2 [Bacteroidaceae bacterium]